MYISNVVEGGGGAHGTNKSASNIIILVTKKKKEVHLTMCVCVHVFYILIMQNIVKKYPFK
jgi:hypothetical protein